MQRRTAEETALLGTARVMMAATIRATGAVGDRISPGQLRTLTLLDILSTANLAELAEDLGVSASSTSRLVDRLVEAGLVLRRTSPRTRREIELSLSPSGRDLLTELDRHRLGELTAALEVLPRGRRREVVAALHDFAAAAAQARFVAHR